MVTVYVLRPRVHGKRYVGITNDLERRLQEHRSRHTKAGQVLLEFEVVLTEEFPNHVIARNREKFLKSGQGRCWLDSALRSRPARGG